MELVSYLFLVILGLIFGSFLGMLTYRLPRDLTLTGRSFCPHCKKGLSWYENIPIFSYIVLDGHCLHCKKRISLRYPVVELLTVNFFLASFLFWNASSSGFAFLLKRQMGDFSLFVILTIVLIFLALAIIDFEQMLLPDLHLGLLTLLVLLILPSPTLFENLLWGTVAGVFFWLIYHATRGGGMGFGDVKLAFIIGSLLGFPGAIVWFYLSFLTGAGVGIILLLLGKARFGKPIPFGPFLLFSAWVTLFFGNVIWEWYGRLL